MKSILEKPHVDPQFDSPHLGQSSTEGISEYVYASLIQKPKSLFEYNVSGTSSVPILWQNWFNIQLVCPVFFVVFKRIDAAVRPRRLYWITKEFLNQKCIIINLSINFANKYKFQ
jgi:hypothetical protein